MARERRWTEEKDFEVATRLPVTRDTGSHFSRRVEKMERQTGVLLIMIAIFWLWISYSTAGATDECKVQPDGEVICIGAPPMFKPRVYLPIVMR